MTVASLLLIFAISDFSLKELKSLPGIKQTPNTMMVIYLGLIEPCRNQSRVWLIIETFVSNVAQAGVCLSDFAIKTMFSAA